MARSDKLAALADHLDAEDDEDLDHQADWHPDRAGGARLSHATDNTDDVDDLDDQDSDEGHADDDSEWPDREGGVRQSHGADKTNEGDDEAEEAANCCLIAPMTTGIYRNTS